MIQLKLGANIVDSCDLHIHLGFHKLKYGWFPKCNTLDVYRYRYILVALLYMNEENFHCIATVALTLMHVYSIIMYDGYGYKHKVPQWFWNYLAWQCIPEITLYITKWRVILHFATLSSVWPSDTVWRHRSRSKFAQVMACCLTAPSHYLDQCWLFII